MRAKPRDFCNRVDLSLAVMVGIRIPRSGRYLYPRSSSRGFARMARSYINKAPGKSHHKAAPATDAPPSASRAVVAGSPFGEIKEEASGFLEAGGHSTKGLAATAGPSAPAPSIERPSPNPAPISRAPNRTPRFQAPPRSPQTRHPSRRPRRADLRHRVHPLRH